jgi:hypothetical protein
MKIRLKLRGNNAHTLLVVLLLGGVLVAVLGSYLHLVSAENKIVFRSVSWNKALPMAEAGIEEAMSHIAFNTNNYSLDGWTQVGTNSIYTKSRTNGLDFYNVVLSGSPSGLKTITSTGTVHVLDNQYVSRVVQVTASSMSFPSPMGLVAQAITLGGGASIDSYNSSNSLYSVNGRYSPALATAWAFLGSPYSGFNVSGSTTVKGYLACPSGFTINVQGAATVGDMAWTGAATKGAQAGHNTNGFTVEIPDPSVPFTSAPAPTTNTVNGTNYTYYLSGGNYMVPSLNAAGSATTMYVDGPSVLYVPGNIQLQSITFGTNANTRLHLYIGSDVTFAPNIYGATPPQFVVWGLPTCTSMDMSGNASLNFTGAIYAPKSALKLTGGSQFYGTITAGSFTSGGNFKFHHDLSTAAGQKAEVLHIVSWAEL